MIERILEPEVMDDELEAQEYDQMDFVDVNTDFAQLVAQLGEENRSLKVLDIGTGTAQIPLILSQLRPLWQIVGVDLADSMLALGQKNIDQANKSDQIKLQLVDGKKMPFADHSFDIVISNSLVHHIPQPIKLFSQIDRVVSNTGIVVLRDLFRPNSVSEIEKIVTQASLDYSSHQKKLFYNSLHAALTIEEIKNLTQQMGWENAKVYQSSSRHWTIVYNKSLCYIP